MQTAVRNHVFHHPFHRLYDIDAHLQSRRNVYLFASAAIQLVTILSAIFDDTLLPILSQGGSKILFLVEGYLFSLGMLLLGLYLGDHAPARNMERLAFALAYAIGMEIPIAIVSALQNLNDMAPV